MTSFSIDLHTLYEVECVRDGKIIWTEVFPNLITTAGKTKLLDATFRAGIGANAWYVGLVNNASFTAYAAADTMASHAGWLEGVPYSDATRIAFLPAAAAAASIDNGASRASFTINATLTVRGSFLVDNSTKSGTTGTLYGVGDFSAARSVVAGDTLNIKLTLTD